MNLEKTRRTIHLGVNFVVAPAPDLAGGKYLDFQRRLAQEKIEFGKATKSDTQAVFVREGPTKLKVQVGEVAQQAVGQLLVVAGAQVDSTSVEAGITSSVFSEEAEVVTDVFEEVWPEQRQVVSRDATLRLLFDSGVPHAFQYLWERRFGQAEQSLSEIGRPVLGGGLRLVMPPIPEEDYGAEVKIESFLRDPSKIFVETGLRWSKPVGEGTLDPRSMVTALETFTQNRVIPFITSTNDPGEEWKQ